jgi:catechol 2,3-dioxygenase-like lactoylglutathione lyase family enzyme
VTAPSTADVQQIVATSFNHLHLNVRDVTRSVRFYEQAFGLHVEFSAGADLLFMAPHGGGLTLALHRVGQDEPVGMAGGFQHFGFKLSADDHDRAITQVERAGGALVSRGKHDGKYPYAYVSDPDGYVIEL